MAVFNDQHILQL